MENVCHYCGERLPIFARLRGWRREDRFWCCPKHWKKCAAPFCSKVAAIEIFLAGRDIAGYAGFGRCEECGKVWCKSHSIKVDLGFAYGYQCPRCRVTLSNDLYGEPNLSPRDRRRLAEEKRRREEEEGLREKAKQEALEAEIRSNIELLNDHGVASERRVYAAKALAKLKLIENLTPFLKDEDEYVSREVKRLLDRIVGNDSKQGMSPAMKHTCVAEFCSKCHEDHCRCMPCRLTTPAD